MKNSNFPANINSQAQHQIKGRNLSNQDADFKMINSGPLGMHRLVFNRAIDLMESYPHLTFEDARLMALGYCALTYGN